MNNLIIIKDDIPTLSPLISSEIIHLQEKIDELQSIIDNYKENIVKEMEEQNIRKIVDDNESTIITISRVDETTRETLDTKRLKKEMLDVYNKYCNITNVKSSVRMSIKDAK